MSRIEYDLIDLTGERCEDITSDDMDASHKFILSFIIFQRDFYAD